MRASYAPNKPIRVEVNRRDHAFSIGLIETIHSEQAEPEGRGPRPKGGRRRAGGLKNDGGTEH